MNEINKEISWKDYLEILDKSEIKLKSILFDERLFYIYKSELLKNKINWEKKEDTWFWIIYHLAPMTYALEYFNEEKLLENIEFIKELQFCNLELDKWYYLPSDIIWYITYWDWKYYLMLTYSKISPLNTKENTYLWHILSVESLLKSLDNKKLEDIYNKTKNIKLSEFITKIKTENIL